MNIISPSKACALPLVLSEELACQVNGKSLNKYALKNVNCFQVQTRNSAHWTLTLVGSKILIMNNVINQLCVYVFS